MLIAKTPEVKLVTTRSGTKVWCERARWAWFCHEELVEFFHLENAMVIQGELHDRPSKDSVLIEERSRYNKKWFFDGTEIPVFFSLNEFLWEHMEGRDKAYGRIVIVEEAND